MWARHTLALATAGLIGGTISTASAQSTIVVAPSALPPPQVETVPPPPTTTSYWQLLLIGSRGTGRGTVYPGHG